MFFVVVKSSGFQLTMKFFLLVSVVASVCAKEWRTDRQSLRKLCDDGKLPDCANGMKTSQFDSNCYSL